jgi:hypothetical protein
MRFAGTVGIALLSTTLRGADAPVSSTPQQGVRATIDEQPKEMVIELGPIDVPETSGPGRPHEVAPQRVIVPIGGWMHGYSVEIVDAAGARLPSRLLHHVYVISPSKRELFTPSPLYVAAAAGETEPVVLPRWIGYEMKKGDTLLVEAGIADRERRAWRGLRVRVRFPRTGSEAFIGAFAIYPFSFVVPSLRVGRDTTPMLGVGRSESYWEGKPGASGRILGLTAHAPRQATLVRLEDRTTNKTLWEARVDTSANGEVLPIPIKQFVGVTSLGLAIDASHVYRFTVVYENRTGAPVRVTDGWGSAGGVFKLGRGARWPSVGGRQVGESARSLALAAAWTSCGSSLGDLSCQP